MFDGELLGLAMSKKKKNQHTVDRLEYLKQINY